MLIYQSYQEPSYNSSIVKGALVLDIKLVITSDLGDSGSVLRLLPLLQHLLYY